ncbi:MAG: FG-GAP-like repeat-containing protein, partial [Balneolaceae bacterium]
MNVVDKNRKLISGFFIAVLLMAVSCSTVPPKPDVHSEKYKKAVSDFYQALAAIQSDQALFAVQKMQQVADAYPSEPAVWANLGVFAMRQGNFELASQHLAKAIGHAPNNGGIQFLAGILESRKGNIDAALDHLKKAAKADSTNLKVLFAFANELERQDPKANAEQIEGLFDEILSRDPNNMAVLLESVRTAAKWDDKTILEKSLGKLEAQSADWPTQLKQRFLELKSKILDKQGENITFELAFLRNNLNQLSQYQHDLEKVELPSNQVGFLISKFIWLPSVDYQAQPADEQLAFRSQDETNREVNLLEPVGLGYEKPAVIEVSGNTAIVNGKYKLTFPGSNADQPLPASAVSAIDYNYDFINDVAFAGPGGFRLYKQQEDSTFKNVTDSLQLPARIKNTPFHGVWADDLDLDGDLDLILAPKNGNIEMLRNNGDGTFEVQKYFPGSGTVRDFIWADFDLDGDPDAVLLTNDGKLLYYSNQRSGEFAPVRTFDTNTPVSAVSFGDLNSDGIFEIISQQGNTIASTSYVDSTGEWETHTLLKVDKSMAPGPNSRIFISDLDNNAALDLMVSGRDTTAYWLSDENITLNMPPKGTTGEIYGQGDINGDNRLDLVGITDDMRPLVSINEGAKPYKARIIRPRASGPLGDQRINSFGIGGVLESRSGLQYTKQPITRPWVHIGLGTY